ncbi:hypothetical protein HMPREF9374_1216 [Desmospora sp. 8437]|nr:hypothetical protein HMPREF9374_1216 [Desmospora sp. 8437]
MTVHPCRTAKYSLETLCDHSHYHQRITVPGGAGDLCFWLMLLHS